MSLSDAATRSYVWRLKIEWEYQLPALVSRVALLPTRPVLDDTNGYDCERKIQFNVLIWTGSGSPEVYFYGFHLRLCTLS